MRNFNENMNSYMFNKVRMMAVACGIAIVSGNHNICGKDGVPGTEEDLNLKTDVPKLKTDNVDLSKYVLKTDVEDLSLEVLADTYGNESARDAVNFVGNKDITGGKCDGKNLSELLSNQKKRRRWRSY